MRKYNLWVDSFSRVEKQLQKNLPTQKNQCKKLKFSVQGIVKENFSMVEVDSLLAGFESEEIFLKYLKEKFNYEFSKNHLICTYKYKNKIKQLDLVYDSKLLFYYAISERQKANENKNSPAFDSKLKKELNIFFDRLISLAEDSKTRNYILLPKEFMKELEYEDVLKLQKYLPKGKKLHNRDYQIYTLHDSLENYISIYDLYCKNLKLNQNTLNNKYDLQGAKKDVYDTLCKNYRTLRNAILFEQVINQIENNKTKPLQDNQITFVTNENNLLYFDDEESKQEYLEYLKFIKDNEEELRQIAHKRELEFRKRYLPEEGEDVEQLVDFGTYDTEYDDEDNITKSKRGNHYG